MSLISNFKEKSLSGWQKCVDPDTIYTMVREAAKKGYFFSGPVTKAFTPPPRLSSH